MIQRRQAKLSFRSIGVMVNIFACMLVSNLQLTEIIVVPFEISIIILNEFIHFLNKLLDDFRSIKFVLLCMQQ